MTAASSARIETYREASRDVWERACSTCPYATFFHTPAFADLFVKAGGGGTVAAARSIRFDDGATCIVPLVKRRFLGGALTLLHSMPGATYGGWISESSLDIRHTRALIAHLLAVPTIIWRENPYDPLLGGVEIAGSGDDFTQTIDLRDGYDAVRTRFDHAHRKAVKKALANDVAVVEASERGDAWEDFFSLYAVSRDRWKERGLLRSRGYGRPLFEALLEIPPRSRKLWMAYVKDHPAAGILCFYWNRHAVAWLGAGAAEYFDRRPNNLLYEHAIRHAAESGFHWFDCNPSGGFKGVAEFKEHLGAKRLRARVVDRRSPLFRAAEWLRGKIG
jgi:hypothetical protein